jgi:hypothetical protein
MSAIGIIRVEGAGMPKRAAQKNKKSVFRPLAACIEAPI